MGLEVIPGNHYLAYVLDEATQKHLLSLFPPKNSVVKCHHVTIAREIKPEHARYFQMLVDMNPVFETTTWMQGPGIELFTVTMNGLVRRFDYKIHHITHSHSTDREANDSNHLLEGRIDCIG